MHLLSFLVLTTLPFLPLTPASPGCGHPLHPPPTPGASTSLLTLPPTHASSPSRQYLLHLPAAYHIYSPAPLILAFHGKGQTAHSFAQQTEFTNPLLNTLGAIVAFPQGVDDMWTGDPAAPSRDQRDDVAFAAALVEHLVRTYCVAIERVYVVGFSNGGGLVHLLACDAGMATRIAAAAIVSGAVYRDQSVRVSGGKSLFDVCEPGRVPVPLVGMHGSRDPVIHYDGKSTPDGETWPVEEWVQGWKVRNGCGEGEGPTWEGEVNGGSVRKRTWSCGVGGRKQEVLVHYRIEGFGHGWPSIKRQEDDEKQRFGPVSWNATRDVVDFFAGQNLPSEWRVPGKRVRDEL